MSPEILYKNLYSLVLSDYYYMGPSDNDSLLGSSPGGGGLSPPGPI
jgi:hypothetical protein